MPVYCYKCKDCQANFEAKHSMNFENQDCIECGSLNIFKVPSMSIYKHVTNSNVKPGKIVDNYIKETKEEIKKEKKSLRKKEL